MAQTENSFNSDAGTEDVDIKAIILKYIDKFPGIRYRQLLRVIGFTNGRLEYHLKILESTQKVTVFRRDIIIYNILLYNVVFNTQVDM